MNDIDQPIPATETASIQRWRDGQVQHLADELVIEEPLEIRVRGRAISVTMRTPGNDEELAAGFLLSEGVISQSSNVLHITHCEKNEAGNTIDVQLAPDVTVDFAKLTRHVFASSSCGLCGKATIESVSKTFSPVVSAMTISSDLLATFPEKMRALQETFDRTGGLHAAALFDAAGELLLLREDVGRHNAVDKILGHALLHQCLPLDRHVLLVSGRSSFEIIQKSISGRIPIVASVSAPSNLAVEFAKTNGQTLIGFLRESRMNIYSQPQRIRFDG